MSTPTFISPHFTLDELTRSQTAQRLGIPNLAGVIVQRRLKRLCVNILEPLRTALIQVHPQAVIHVDSAYRSVELNSAIGGAKMSQHCDGAAADIVVPGMTPLQLCEFIIDLHLPFDQLIYEGNWTHVSTPSIDGDVPRGKVLTAVFKPGQKTTYISGLIEGKAR